MQKSYIFADVNTLILLLCTLMRGRKLTSFHPCSLTFSASLYPRIYFKHWAPIVPRHQYYSVINGCIFANAVFPQKLAIYGLILVILGTRITFGSAVSVNFGLRLHSRPHPRSTQAPPGHRRSLPVTVPLIGDYL